MGPWLPTRADTWTRSPTFPCIHCVTHSRDQCVFTLYPPFKISHLRLKSLWSSRSTPDGQNIVISKSLHCWGFCIVMGPFFSSLLSVSAFLNPWDVLRSLMSRISFCLPVVSLASIINIVTNSVSPALDRSSLRSPFLIPSKPLARKYRTIFGVSVIFEPLFLHIRDVALV